MKNTCDMTERAAMLSRSSDFYEKEAVKNG